MGDPQGAWGGEPIMVHLPSPTFPPCCLLMLKTCYHSFNDPCRQQSTVSITYSIDCHIVVKPQCWTATSLMSHSVNCHTITVPRTLVAQPLHPSSHLYHLSSLTSLHSSVNWHLHCTCEVYWSFVNGTYSFGTHMHLYTHQTRQTLTPTCRNLYPCWRVWVFPGKGTGSPGIPQGYPWQSLTIGAMPSIKQALYWPPHCSPRRFSCYNSTI